MNSNQKDTFNLPIDHPNSALVFRFIYYPTLRCIYPNSNSALWIVSRLKWTSSFLGIHAYGLDIIRIGEAHRDYYIYRPSH